MMEGDEFVVDRGKSRFGLHMVHVLGPRPVDVERVQAEECPEDATVWCLDYKEEDMEVYHLLLFWKEKGAEYYEWK